MEEKFMNEEVSFEPEYNKWDEFIADLMFSILNAQGKFKYFVLTELNHKEPYDLLFFAVSHRANQFNGCELFCYPKNFIKFLLFKRKERAARYISRDAKAALHMERTHICNSRERVELIEELALKNNIHIEEIPQIYKEYYSR